MGDLRKIRFVFGADAEVRYMAQLPQAGEFVTHGGALWVVSAVRSGDQGAVVVCELPKNGSEAARRSGSLGHQVADLGEDDAALVARRVGLARRPSRNRGHAAE
jgi:hypothetical protein